MERLLKKGVSAFFLGASLNANDWTYTIVKKEELGHKRFLKKKCLKNTARHPCFARPKRAKRKPLNLDKNSYYYGTSVVQMSWLESKETFKNHSEYKNIPFAEVSLIFGYKHFFPKKEHYGFRYYAFLDYAYGFLPKSKSDFKASLRESLQIPKSYQNKLQKKETFINTLIYGMGADIVYKRAFGTLILGVNLVGETWFYETNIFKQWAKNPLNTYHPNMFQVMLNAGYRYRFSRHKNWAIELGTRIPFLINRYFKTPLYSLYFKRNLSIYLTSTYDF
ncbi:outer membrane protein [Helicobacter acinonychis]|uniref:Outer membrane protein 10 n=2 Tax=Helicobacter acinonychis TaxID=212 RepID=Q17XD1_HELAH|nr:outer membrane protein [Helicobacter acinonychis]CAJ99695.1 outer membrane protein 10 [Helicobacter acinonychis str. Sheeba]SFZ70447.1 OMP82 [Helicobacter acinonychis]SFZ70736.1 OMP844 [Helicobacter acinonychis]SFZ70838.1 OMP1651 [Helicobacter acinonychis]STP04256.1 outer membrane protein 10 [Helicobacter acinonychis]